MPPEAGRGSDERRALGPKLSATLEHCQFVSEGVKRFDILRRANRSLVGEESVISFV